MTKKINNNDNDAEPAIFITGKEMLKPLRSLGLSEISGLCELTDNAIDARATEVNIWVESLYKDKDGTHHLGIVCMDNGEGFKDQNVTISSPTGEKRTCTLLTHAITYGGRAEKEETLQRIGKFGFGLPSTILHLCSEDSEGAVVITKNELESSYRYCKVDFMRMSRTGNYSLTQERGDIGELGHIPGPIDRPMQIGKSGTIIWLKDCKSEFNSKNEFVREAIKEFGMTYRRYLQSGINIRINGIEVEFNDPLCQNKLSKERLAGLPGPVFVDEFSVIFDGGKPGEDDGDIHWKKEIINDETGEFAKINVKMVRLNATEVAKANSRSHEDYGKDSEQRVGRKFNMANQGFYLVRNQRQIRGGENLGLYTTQDRLNYFRSEITFPDCLDEFFGIEADKSRLRMNRSLSQRLKEKIKPILARMRKDHNNEVANKRSQEGETEPEAEKIIASAKPMPKITASDKYTITSEKKRAEDFKKKKEEIEADDTLSSLSKSRQLKRIQEIESNRRQAYIYTDVIRSSVLYEVRPRSKGIDIVVNSMTEFFEHVYSPSKDNPDHKKLLDIMLAMLGWAESTMVEDEEDDNYLFWKQARASMGASMGSIVEQLRRTYNPSEDM